MWKSTALTRENLTSIGLVLICIYFNQYKISLNNSTLNKASYSCIKIFIKLSICIMVLIPSQMWISLMVNLIAHLRRVCSPIRQSGILALKE